MDHFDNLAGVHLNRPSIVTIGVFDGMHKGHQRLLTRLVEAARARDCLSVVLTFFPHPDRVLRNATGRYYLNTPAQRNRWLSDLGVDVVITHPFDDSVRQIRAAAFLDQLLAHLAMVSLWVTTDFAMGYKREGNFDFLKAQSAAKGFELQQIELVMADSQTKISSTAIRDTLLAGDMVTAAALLGRPYQVEGPVVQGDSRGGLTGYPTANIQVWEEQIIPANGVYACFASVRGARYMAMTNVGVRPTFAGQDVRVEAHLLDFNQQIYGETVTLDFIERLRGEQKFSGIEALVKQIGLDVERGRALLAHRSTSATPER